ncbi:hypothetical protein BC938DRAFT_471064 [Jimgerdemannia flammicorona]|uniref:Uncharacterized protein n=1 Tax=Jimgerdemannia flammicorona TaxID=994334 RepID=A0A433QV16_9FUNG|nr:hypothetical protein BC938DRAFT_471064 [Jimgerdemannia flammicorona]
MGSVREPLEFVVLEKSLSDYDKSLEALEQERIRLELIIKRMNKEWAIRGSGIGWMENANSTSTTRSRITQSNTILGAPLLQSERHHNTASDSSPMVPAASSSTFSRFPRDPPTNSPCNSGSWLPPTPHDLSLFHLAPSILSVHSADTLSLLPTTRGLCCTSPQLSRSLSAPIPTAHTPKEVSPAHLPSAESIPDQATQSFTGLSNTPWRDEIHRSHFVSSLPPTPGESMFRGNWMNYDYGNPT